MKYIYIAKELYAKSRDRYLYICSEPIHYASAIGRQSREEALSIARYEVYRKLVEHQLSQKYEFQSYDESLLQPQPRDVYNAELFIYVELYKSARLVLAQLQRLRGNFRIPMTPQKSVYYPRQWFVFDEEEYAQKLRNEKVFIEYLEKQDSRRSQWKQEIIYEGGKSTFWVSGYWLCPNTEHSETPELNFDGQNLSDASSSNSDFNPAFPPWYRRRYQFMKQIYTEIRKHLQHSLSENGIQAHSKSIAQSSFIYAIANYQKEKTVQILKSFTAKMNSCRLIMEKREIISDCQAPTTRDIYQQLQAIWKNYGQDFNKPVRQWKENGVMLIPESIWKSQYLRSYATSDKVSERLPVSEQGRSKSTTGSIRCEDTPQLTDQFRICQTVSSCQSDVPLLKTPKEEPV